MYSSKRKSVKTYGVSPKRLFGSQGSTGSYRRATKITALRKSAVMQATKQEINRQLSVRIEKKCAQLYEPGITLQSTAAATWDANNVRNVGFGATEGFNITQGVGQGQRVGNRLRIKKMTMKGVLVPMPYDIGTNPTPRPQQIRMVFFYNKATPTSKPIPKANFLQLGNTQNSLQNDLMDMVAPFNTDNYAILGTRSFKLGLSQFWGDGGSTAPGDAVAGYYSNNDFKYNINFSVDLAKMLPTTCVYNDTNAAPNTRSIFVAWILCRADGSANLSAVQPVSVQYVIDLQYEDA